MLDHCAGGRWTGYCFGKAERDHLPVKVSWYWAGSEAVHKGMSVGTGRDCMPIVSRVTSRQHSSSEMMRLAGFMMEVDLD